MAKSKKVRTQVCFLLDETASMQTRKTETIQGFNGYIKELQKDKGDEVLFTLTTFNKGGIKTPYKATPIKDVKPLDDKSYNPQNWTPLYDAIGTTILALDNVIEKKDLVIFVILTDGEENCSQEYKLDTVKSLVQSHEKDGWKFTFLGVGIDAFQAGGSIGLSASSSFTIGSSGVKTTMMYNTLADNTTQLRATYGARGLEAMADVSLFNDKDRDKLKD